MEGIGNMQIIDRIINMTNSYNIDNIKNIANMKNRVEYAK
jgi:hypothetical protein